VLKPALPVKPIEVLRNGSLDRERLDPPRRTGHQSSDINATLANYYDK
jgi:hypothetical protein